MENINLFQLFDKDGEIETCYGVIDNEKLIIHKTDKYGNWLNDTINLGLIYRWKIIQHPTENDLMSMW